ncbi:MAG: photosynthetic reaction center cytochrome c subunit, partial [Comamonadaceae bacterium]
MNLRLAFLLAAALLAGCERPPVKTVQTGYRGTGMEQVINPRLLADRQAAQPVPDALPAAPADGPKAGQVFQNVKVLGNLSVGEFTRVMTAMTQWVAPNQGCVYCHNPQNFADDSLYTKVVARRMVQMTQHINADWKAHVANTGVTCYTCHRGNNVPQQAWFAPLDDRQALRLAGSKAGQNAPSEAGGGTSLPLDPFTAFLKEDQNLRVIGPTALPTGNRSSTKQAEWNYSLMTHMSNSLGVNCTFCHNSRSFASWQASTPQRAVAWHGIRMARDINVTYLEPLTANFPVNRLGPKGDVAKVNCATCHQGANKPLYGASMLSAHPELAGPGPVALAGSLSAAAAAAE